MKKMIPALMVASMVFLSGCGQKAKVDNSPAVIKINNTAITKNMFEDSLKNGPLASGNIDVNKPENRFVMLIYKSKSVNDLIVRELFKQEAEKRKLTVSEDEINAKIAEITEKVGGSAKFEASLVQNNLNKNTFKDLISFDMLKEKLVNNLSGQNNVSENEVRINILNTPSK